jgi:hypothetical protein
MDHAGLTQIAEQILHDWFASDTDFPDAAVERADRERHAEPDRQELADLGAGHMITDRQGCDEGGQGRRQASLSSRSRERPGTVDSTPTPGRAAVPQAHSSA